MARKGNSLAEGTFISAEGLNNLQNASASLAEAISLLVGIGDSSEDATRKTSGLTKEFKNTEAAVKKVKNESQTVGRALDELAGVASRLYEAFGFSKLVSGAQKLSEALWGVSKNVQVNVNASLAETLDLMTSVTQSVRQMNKEIGQGLVGSDDFAKAVQQLASVGWSDLSSISDVAGSLALINKSMGTLSVSMLDATRQLSYAFGNGTADLVEGVGDILNSYTSVMGLTSEVLQSSFANMSASFTRMANGNAETFQKFTTDFANALSTASQMGVSAESITGLLKAFSTQTMGQLSSQYGAAFGILGVSLSEFSQQVNSGNAYQAIANLLESAQERLQSAGAGTETQRVLLQILQGMGLSIDELQALMSADVSISEIMANNSEIQNAISGSMANEISEIPMSFGERLQNLFSSAGFVNSLTSIFGSLGLGSIGSMGEAFAGMTNAFSSIGKMSGSGFLGTTMSKALGSSGSTVGGIFSSFVGSSGGGLGGLMKGMAGSMSALLPLLGKVIAIIAIIIIALEILGRAFEQSEAMQEAIANIRKALNSIFDLITGTLSEAIDSVVPLFVGLMDGLAPVFNVITDTVMNLIDELRPSIESSAALATEISKTFQPIMEKLIEAGAPILQLFMELFTIQIKGIIAGVSNAIKIIWNILKPVLNFITNNVLPVVTDVVNTISKVMSGIINGIAGICNWLADFHILEWYPFEFLRMEASDGGGTVGAPEITEITNDTVQNQFNETNTAAGGLTYGFGYTGSGIHMGEDIPMSSGTPMSLSQAGIVTGTGYNDLYGNWASIVTGDGLDRLFAHMTNVNAEAGDLLMPGQTFGESGNTGNSLMPHVHYEVRDGGTFVNPRVVASPNNRDVVEAIEVMTSRLERKLEEVSQKTDENAEWIKEFKERSKAKDSYAY